MKSSSLTKWQIYNKMHKFVNEKYSLKNKELPLN